MYRILTLAVLLTAIAGLVNCGGTTSGSSKAPLQNPGDTPTEAYTRLYTAVKNKDTEAIQAEVSASTQGLAKFLAARQKAPIDKVYENGFTRTTSSPTLPEMRDERVKDNMGALEVWNSREAKWEDLPFIRETSGWKLAFGEVFANKYVSPGKGMAEKEREAANAAAPNKALREGSPASNANSNSNGQTEPTR